MTIRIQFQVDRGGFHLDVDVDFQQRGITAVFGPSGCGKTTLLRAIAGLDRYSNGFLQIGDQVWQSGTKFVPPHRRALGYVFQESSLFPHLTVIRNLEYGYSRVPEDKHKIDMDTAVELLEIGGILHRFPVNLSGGEQQRVAIARAILSSPTLLLMDEPLGSLDLPRKLEILPFIDALHRDLGIPVIYVSHDRDEVARLADNMLLMSNGQMVAIGKVNAMLTRVDLPLIHGDQAEAVINAVVSRHDPEYQLTSLDSSAGRITVTGNTLPVNTSVRLRILARDVSLTLARQKDTSILNIFPATVDGIVPEGKAQVTVRLLVNDTPLLARITRKSADNLKLRPGMHVYAQTKSVALLA